MTYPNHKFKIIDLSIDKNTREVIPSVCWTTPAAADFTCVHESSIPVNKNGYSLMQLHPSFICLTKRSCF